MMLNILTLGTIAQTLMEAFDEEMEGMGDAVGPDMGHPKKTRKSHNNRNRRCIRSIFHELGPCFVRRAHRMDAPAFWKLLKLLNTHLDSTAKHLSNERGGGKKNGIVSNATRLS